MSNNKFESISNFLMSKKEISLYCPEPVFGRPGDNFYRLLNVKEEKNVLLICFAESLQVKVEGNFDLIFDFDFMDLIKIEKLTVKNESISFEWTDCELRIQ